MKRELLKLITESRKILPYATAEQKLRLLQLIKENIKQKTDEKSSNVKDFTSKKQDYLEEK